MQFSRQDSNFKIEYLNDNDMGPLEELHLPCHSELRHLDRKLHKLHSNNIIRFTKYQRVNKVVTSKHLPVYQEFVHPYFTDYLENYTERHNLDNDRLIVLLRKLLQVDFKISAAMNTITKHHNKFDVLCAEIETSKKKWKKRTFTLNLRLYEFVLNSEEDSDEGDERNETNDNSSDQSSSSSASGCGCCDECHHNCKGGCGCQDCECRSACHSYCDCDCSSEECDCCNDYGDGCVGCNDCDCGENVKKICKEGVCEKGVCVAEPSKKKKCCENPDDCKACETPTEMKLIIETVDPSTITY